MRAAGIDAAVAPGGGAGIGGRASGTKQSGEQSYTASSAPEMVTVTVTFAADRTVLDFKVRRRTI
jgi:hypothetical protein